MRSEPAGLMFALMEPTPENEEEFNDWYDTEHLPERAECPGFLTALRLICVEGWPRYGALYDLDGVDVLHTPEYLSFAGRRPWSSRILTKVRGFLRWTGVAVRPGRTLTGDAGLAPRLLAVKFDAVPTGAGERIARALDDFAAREPGVVQARLFRSEFEDDRQYLALVETRAANLGDALDLAAFGETARYVGLMNLYVRYARLEGRAPMEKTHRPGAAMGAKGGSSSTQ